VVRFLVRLRARNETAAAKMIDEMALDELREARDLTQEQLARLLHVNQAAISKMEQRAEMYITTLQGVISPWAAGWRSALSCPMALCVSASFRT